MVLPPGKMPFAVVTLSRVPLAEAFYQVWAFLADEPVLQALYEQHRDRCYQDQLRFQDLVQVLTEALTRYHGSGRRAILQALEQERLPSRQRAVYGKLARVPLRLSEALLAALTARLRELLPCRTPHALLPASLAGLQVVVLDGKKIKKAAKRLLATRGRPGKLYGGKILAAYAPRQGMVVALASDPDGEANDIRLVPLALEAVRAAVDGPRLYVADRQFCDLDQPARFTESGDHFLVRFAAKTSFELDPERPAQRGVDAAGRPVLQEWGRMGSPKDRRRRYVRRITLERPGQEAVVLITDLLDADRYPAADLLAVYLARWQIEGVFQQITEVFGLQSLIGSAPQATVFQACLCLVIYNVLQLLRGIAAEVAPGPEPVPVAALSTEQIFTDLHEELIGLHRMLGEEELLGVLPGPATAGRVKERLRELLAAAWKQHWRKAVNKKPRPGKPQAKQSGAHTSVHKILQAAKEKKAPGPAPPS